MQTAPPTQAQASYKALLTHLDECADCRRTQPCTTGTRIRQALREARATAAAPSRSVPPSEGS
jgi:hypothetical protein